MVFLPRFGTLVRRAVLAGGGVDSSGKPEAVDHVPTDVVPEGWQSLPLSKLRALVAEIWPDEEPVKNKADAVARIEAALEARGQ